VAFLVPPKRGATFVSSSISHQGFSIITNDPPRQPRPLALLASVANGTATDADATMSTSDVKGDEAGNSNRNGNAKGDSAIPNVVLVAGFESFNRDL
jgi:hypothetical protein